MDARRALLGELIDHAPFFPPASLPLDEALAEHRRARAGPHAWMLRRFVAPASPLGGLDGELRLSVVLDAPVGLDDPRIEGGEGPPRARERPGAPRGYLPGSIEPRDRAEGGWRGGRGP